MTEFTPTEEHSHSEINPPRVLPLYPKWLKEIANTPESPPSPWLPQLAQLSLRLIEQRSKPSPKTEASASAGCYFNKKVLETIIQMHQNGASKEEILAKMQTVFRDYAFVVAAPLAAYENPNPSLRNQLLSTFVGINFYDKTLSASPDFLRSYEQFNKRVREESLAVQQGIFGEFLAYLFLKQAGYSPIPTNVPEDLKGIDFHLMEENNKRIPLQIKTNLHQGLFAISVKAGWPIFIFLNPEEILKQPHLVNALFGQETPEKSCIINFAEELNSALKKFKEFSVNKHQSR